MGGYDLSHDYDMAIAQVEGATGFQQLDLKYYLKAESSPLLSNHSACREELCDIIKARLSSACLFSP